MDKSFTQKMREQRTGTPEKVSAPLPRPKPLLSTAQICAMIGIMADRIEEVIYSDITGMIEEDMRDQLLGYTLAVSRFIEHKRALAAFEKAFQAKKEPMPKLMRELLASPPSPSALPPSPSACPSNP